MPIHIKTEELLDLARNFYVLTGIRFILLDENYNEILCYPKERSPFCACMRQNPAFDRRCAESDKISFENCRATRELTVYRCHAGLIEATAPLLDHGRIVGYIMFGQIADKKDEKDLPEKLFNYCAAFSPVGEIGQYIRNIRFRNEEQIAATARILDACTSYILLKEMVRPTRRRLFDSIDGYVDSHLRDKISVAVLCREFGISRTRLYEAMKPYVGGGIAFYVKQKRLEKAKEYLLAGEGSIPEVADLVGFTDYNYFLRVFKGYFGVSPKRFVTNDVSNGTTCGNSSEDASKKSKSEY